MSEFTRSNLPLYHVNWRLAHLHLARSCMCYVSICLKNTQNPGRSSNGCSDHLPLISRPLRDYVLEHAPDHFGHLGPRIGSILHDVKVLERDITTHSKMWDNMCLSANRIMRCTTPSWPTSRHDLLLYIMVAFGPNSVLRDFLRCAALNPKQETNPLIYVAYFNKSEHAQTLLSRGARLNCKGWETDGLSQALPIEVAVQNRHYDIVTLFVEGSPIPLRTFSMLYHRMDYAKISSPIVKLLFQTDDFAEAANGPLTDVFLRPLALFNCFLNNDITEQDLIVIIRRAIQVGYDPFEDISCRDTLLRVAARKGHTTVLRYLFSLGVSLPSGLLVTLDLKHMQNPTCTIRFLIENGADPLAHTKRGDTVLHVSLAAFEEDEALETAKLLVARGCDPLGANLRRETPLHVAVKQGHVSVAHYFLSHGALLPPGLVMTCLQTMRNPTRMICLVIDNGANALLRTANGDSVLHVVLATFNEHDALETAKLLVARGCNPTEVNSSGQTPLRVAIERRHVSVARYLFPLSRDSDPDLLLSLVSQGMRDGAITIRFLIENGVDASVRTRGGDNLLHFAMTFREDEALEMTKLLVSRGCDSLQANSRGETPLHIAVKQGHVSVVQYVLSLGVSPPSDLLASLSSRGLKNPGGMARYLIESRVISLARTINGEPALHIILAAFDELDALDTARLLVAHGCDPLEANIHGDTPICIALKWGLIPVVHYLLSLDVPLPSHLLAALSFGDGGARMLRDLVKNGVKVNTHYPDGDSVLHTTLLYCTEREALDTVKLLVAHGCDPLEANFRGKTPIRIAIERGYVCVARYLLSVGVPLSSDLFTAREGARMIRFLVENGLDVQSHPQNRESLLHYVIKYFPDSDALETTELLLASGCDPLQTNSQGQTPVRIAIERGHVLLVHHLLSLGVPLPSDALFVSLSLPRPTMYLERKSDMVHFLIRQGANVLIKESNGDSVIHKAIMAFYCDDSELLEVITLLVSCGCDPAIANACGVTPLHVAVEKGDSTVVDHLLSLGAPLPPDTLFTALESDLIPSRGMMMDVIEVLVSSGCDIAARNGAGHTPLYVAVTRGYLFVVDYLLAQMDGAPSEDLRLATAQLPPEIREMVIPWLDNRLARLTRPDEHHDDRPAAKRARHS